jgi:nucleotide-binding universal stress UspA family protein
MAPSLGAAALGATAEGRRERLVAAARDEDAALIATPATEPAGGVGSAACLALADTAPCPVLAVPLSDPSRRIARGSIVCGIDDRDRPGSVACTAARLALALGTRLELVHVATPPDSGARRRDVPSGTCMGVLWRALHMLDAMPPVDVVLELGEPAQRLGALAESERTLLVIGAPTNAGMKGEQGGVASTVVAESRVPVVLVPARAAEVEGAPGTAGRMAA